MRRARLDAPHKASALRGNDFPGLLDTYQDERHPVGGGVLKMTDALYKLVMSGSRFGTVLRRALIRLVVRLAPARKRLAERLSGIGIHYDRPTGAHPWTGRRMPYSREVYEALREGKFVLIGDKPDGWSDRVVMATSPGSPAFVLVRPDGYVAWANDTSDGLQSALGHWCGAAV